MPVPGAVTALEGAEQLPPGIEAEQVSVAPPVKPPTPVTVTAIVPEAPGLRVTGNPLSVKSHAVPVKGTVCGLPAALSVMVNVAAWLPLAPAGGVNVMLMTHDAFAATVAPLVQVVPDATAKSAAFAPEIEGAAVMFRLALPVFVTVTTCAVLVVVTS